MSTTKNAALLPSLTLTVEQLTKQFDQITTERKELLKELTRFVEDKNKKGETANLNFICTHNSRRSHLSQLWAKAAAVYYDISNVMCYSGGTEATAFNPSAVKAMQQAGFAITRFAESSDNPVYDVRYSDNEPPIRAFSKKYDDPFNPKKDFAAIMTCSHADENCPLVVGASARIALTYEDPKEFDGTLQESAKYSERVHEIGREILYAFSIINK